MKPFTAKVIEVIKQIPKGKVMTYGQIAKVAGSPRGARQVVRILHTLSDKYDLPWHRVINIKGEIVIKDDESSTLQKMYLQDEGVSINQDNRIDLSIYRYQPDPYDFEGDDM